MSNFELSKKQWDWSFILKVGMFTLQERERISRIVANLETRAAGITKPCPNCKELCIRPPELHNKRIRCTSCYGTNFCFSCGKPWKSNGLQLCGNNDCSDNQLLEVLKYYDQEDQKVTISGISKVPKIRLCPSCFNIIEWMQQCKHMICTNPQCKYEFCFACLEKYPCKECKVKPTQILN